VRVVLREAAGTRATGGRQAGRVVEPEGPQILYVNGQPQPPPIWQLAPGAGIPVAGDAQFAIGNRDIGGRSFEGTLLYVALYARALTPDEVARHAQILALDDDSPR
jgi:hypothetical protein